MPENKDKDSFYIKLDVNAYDDPKVKLIRKYHGNMAGFGSYILIALKLRQEADCKLDYDDFVFESLGIDLDKSPEEVKKFIDDCIKYKLLTLNDKKFFSERVNRDKAKLDEKREKARMAGIISAEKRKQVISQPEPETSHDVKPESKQKIHPYPDLRNISLTEDEHKKLIEKFGEQGTKDKCEALSLYKTSKGKVYKSDYATILNWDRRHKEEDTQFKKSEPLKSQGKSLGMEIEE